MGYPLRSLLLVLFGLIVAAAPFSLSGCKEEKAQAATPAPQIVEKGDPIVAIAAQSDPDKLKTLKPEARSINGRMDKILYWMFVAEQKGITPDQAIARSFNRNGCTEPRRSMATKQLLQNYKTAKQWGLFTEENLARLKRGNAALITKGSYLGQICEIDHIVPVARYPHFANELANLQLMPAIQNRSKGDKIGRVEQEKLKELQALREESVVTSSR